MNYGITLSLLGLIQVGLAIHAGPFGWLLVWSGLSWLVAGCSYAFPRPNPFGKRSNGSLSGWNTVLLLPFLIVTWLLWHLKIALDREPPHVEVAPGIWLGRRCYHRELPPGIQTVVDLTAEFAEPKRVRDERTYVSVPTLDTSIPALPAFSDLIGVIVRSQAPVYVHCALGHGRSATVVIAVLTARGIANSVEEAEVQVKQARPAIGINAVQRKLLQQWVERQRL